MLHLATLRSNAELAHLCPNLQPNSQQWQIAGFGGLREGSLSGMGLFACAAMPSDSATIATGNAPVVMTDATKITGRLGVSEQAAGIGKMGRQVLTEVSSVATYQGYNGNFNKSNSDKGNHSRRDGWPPTDNPGPRARGRLQGGSAAAS